MGVLCTLVKLIDLQILGCEIVNYTKMRLAAGLPRIRWGELQRSTYP